MTTVAALAYHKIGPPPPNGWDTWFFVPELTFAEQLAYLRGSDWQVIDLAAFRRGLDDPASLPDRSVLLTFDDGYLSMRAVALPLLQRFGYPGVLFVPTDFIGCWNVFDGNEPAERLCDWADLRELVRNGVAVQSHGASHRAFSDLAPAELDGELRRSKQVLEDGLGKAVDVLAYPYGDAVGSRCEAAGYRAAFRYKGGRFRLPAGDRFRLRRIPIGSDTDLARSLGSR